MYLKTVLTGNKQWEILRFNRLQNDSFNESFCNLFLNKNGSKCNIPKIKYIILYII